MGASMTELNYNRGRKPYSKRNDLMVRLKEEGSSYNELAEIFGVSKAAVVQAINRHKARTEHFDNITE